MPELKGVFRCLDKISHLRGFERVFIGVFWIRIPEGDDLAFVV